MIIGLAFGSDTRFTGIQDFGFGDPTPSGGVWDFSAVVDVGFGDPPRAPYVPLPLRDGDQYPDDGELVRLIGQWPRRGDYRVRIIDGNGTIYPPGQPGCYSAAPGKGTKCTTDPSLRILLFALPPLPLGTYSIEVAWGAEFGETMRLDNAITVIPRGQATEVYAARRRLPLHWRGAGARSAQLDPPDLPTHPTSPLYTLTRVFGQLWQDVAGLPETRLTAPLVFGSSVAAVESTIGFADSGACWINGIRHTYTGRTPTSLTGLVPVVETWAEIPSRSEVVFDARTVVAA